MERHRKDRTVDYSVGYPLRTSAGDEFLNEKTDYLTGFTTVVFRSDQGNFSVDPIDAYGGREIEVKGTVTTYEGHPEIIVTDPTQIRLVNSASAGTSSVAPSSGPLAIIQIPPSGSGLDWTGFPISVTECALVDGGSRAQATGTATVPSLAGRGTVLGQVEVWVVDQSGSYVGSGKPWPLPNATGVYMWNITVDIPSAAVPVKCVVQGIDPRASFQTPQ